MSNGWTKGKQYHVYTQQVDAAKVIQRTVRQWRAQPERMIDPATTIQRVFRRFQRRQKAHYQRLVHTSATTIQRHVRGYMARNNEVKSLKQYNILQLYAFNDISEVGGLVTS